MRTFRVAVYFALVILGLSGREAAGQKPTPPPSWVVPPPPISSLTLTPNTVVGSGSCGAQVVLNGAVGGAHVVINLQSTNPAVATVPATVIIARGSSSATFTIQTRLVSSSTSVSITAQSGSSAKTAELKVDPISLKSLDAYRNMGFVKGGKTISFEAGLNAAAPPGGAVVMLFTSQPSVVAIPGFVKVPEGALTVSFPAVIAAVKDPTKASVTGNYGGASRHVVLNLGPPEVASIQLAPDTATGGSSVTGLLTLSGSAPSGGWRVYLRFDQPGASMSFLMTIPEGASQGNFNLTTVPVLQMVRTNVFEVPSLLGDTYPLPVSATLTINPPALTSFRLVPESVSSQAGTVNGWITLSGPAAAGTSVPLSWSSVEAATAPSTVPVAEGATSANFKVILKPVATPTPFTLSAYYGGARMSATLTVTP